MLEGGTSVIARPVYSWFKITVIVLGKTSVMDSNNLHCLILFNVLILVGMKCLCLF